MWWLIGYLLIGLTIAEGAYWYARMTGKYTADVHLYIVALLLWPVALAMTIFQFIWRKR